MKYEKEIDEHIEILVTISDRCNEKSVSGDGALAIFHEICEDRREESVQKTIIELINALENRYGDAIDKESNEVKIKIMVMVAKADVVDKQGDMFTREALQKQVGHQSLFVFPKMDEECDAIGKCISMNQKGDELFAEIDIFDAEIAHKIKENKLDVVFRPSGMYTSTTEDTKDGKVIRIISNMNLYRISMVPIEKDVYGDE